MTERPGAAIASATAIVSAAPPASAAPSAVPPAPNESYSIGSDRPPLPDGFVYGEDGGEVKCGKLRVEGKNDDPRVYQPYVRVFDERGQKLYESHGRSYELGKMSLVVDFCGDLTGDGVPELFLTERTMGAHCCYTHYVVSMTTPVKVLMTWDKGDGGFDSAPRKLKAGDAWQIVTSEVVWPPFDAEKGDDPVLSYASAPVVPVIFDLVGDRYEKRTLAFADALRAMWNERREACKKDESSCDSNEIIDWCVALMTGDWERDKLKLVPEAKLRASLVKHAPAMRKLLKKQLGG